jgi:hypothetical protein
MYASRMRQGTFNYFVLPHATGNVQSALCFRYRGGTPFTETSHVKQFPNVLACDDYYDIVVVTCEIGVEQFATRLQQ